MSDASHILWLDDVASVGGKNASLGELILSLAKEGIRVPGGFATSAAAYREFLSSNDLRGPLEKELEKLADGAQSLEKTGKAIRRRMRAAEFPEEIADAVREAYRELCDRHESRELAVAVRSSATAEDLPEASFAGQQETYLNVTGEEDLLDASRGCYASLFTDRAIAYRDEHGFDHMKVAVSVGVQKTVRADRAASGVMFSIDTETGFPGVVVINASWGAGQCDRDRPWRTHEPRSHSQPRARAGRCGRNERRDRGTRGWTGSDRLVC